MEQKIDVGIDNFFSGSESIIYTLNMVLAALLILVGIGLILKKSAHKKTKIQGYVCIVIGILTIISRIIQGIL